jgi:hypothetical protein
MDVRTAQPKLRPIIAGAALLGLTLTFASWPAISPRSRTRFSHACLAGRLMSGLRRFAPKPRTAVR